VIPRHTFNHGKTRNKAAMEATGDMLIFMTQDALPLDHTLFRTLTDPLHVHEIAATFGRHIPRPDASPLEVFARQFSYPDAELIKGLDTIKQYGIKAFRFSNVCSAVKKDVFFKIGMFPHDIRSNEDMILAAKLILEGYRVAYIPKAVVIHSHNYSLRQQFRRYANIGSSLKHHSWILQYAQAEKEGRRFIKEQLSFVLKRHEYRWIPYIFLESMTKYVGYRIGLFTG
jgi:rhamnosyltransferase